ncbi:hybrid sensor histidine kinase/response regulator [Sinorhizobium glycinis]|uniref:Chemotaxis protein CheA n=1 Tax=Sinorhizobium glycinis TaxID=1472378 RepID=A0A178XNY1_9HYPH|nr:response regulator [Sinorhizobium glycinis]OAP36452.1 hybrid sensor histidine kinase/response regulator [Sinorhizobium glycinis]
MMKAEELDRQLLKIFTQEVRERSCDMERMLIGIEEAEGADEKRRLQDQLLRMAHSLKGAAGLVQVRGIESICHWMEEVLTHASKEGSALDRTKLDLLLRAADAIAEAGRLLAGGEMLSSAGAEGVALELQAAVAPGMSHGSAPPKPPSPPAAHQVPVRSTDLDGSMRVSADRLDALLHRSGELLAFDAVVRAHADRASRLREQARRLRTVGSCSETETAGIETGLRELAASLRNDGRLMHSAVTALDHEVRRARTQPFAAACKGLERIVRDMAAHAGKSAALEIRGGEIEIDRSILAGLQDSLRHLVRNAVAHGIQSPEERRLAGKLEKGRIVVSASVSGDRVQVVVQDDGRGLDTASLRKLAGQTDSIESEEEGDLLQRIFEPGISTSASVNRLSGRGIGLDIVRRAVEDMRGTANVAQVPEGGAAFTLTLPLTLATVRALEIHVAGHVLTIDTSSVERVIRVAAEDIGFEQDRPVVTTGAGTFPLVDLARWLGLRAAGEPISSEARPAIIIRAGGRQTAVLVDAVAGEQELLARSLGPRLQKVRRYCGGMVLHDGRIALLLNTSLLAGAAPETHAAPIPDAGQIATSERRKVLVVDDSKYIRTLVRLILQAAGYDVAMASDGQEALQHLRHHEVDVVVADVDMPAMDGLELTQAIRSSDRLAGLPIILITGREAAEDRARGLEAGANAYFAKNRFDAHQFLETVSQVV